jgi:hypothetical protein
MDFNKTIKKVRCLHNTLLYKSQNSLCCAIKFNADPATYHPICPSQSMIG